MILANPYIFFSGQAEEAMEFYKSIFGGQLEKVPFSETGFQPKGYRKRSDARYAHGWRNTHGIG